MTNKGDPSRDGILVNTRKDFGRKRLSPNARVAELEGELDAAQHLLNEIVIAAFRREHERDPASKAEYRAYHRKLYEEAVAAMETRTEAPEWLSAS
jgi:hypothetical protein